MLEWERNWLRRYAWFFPIVGIPLGCLLGGLLWAFILIDRTFLPASFEDWISAKGLVVGVAFGFIPIFWIAGLHAERKWGCTLRRFGIAPLGAFLLFLAAEWALRTPYGQTVLWQGVRARAGENFFAREVALFRLGHAVTRNPEPGVVAAGTSQMLHALDARELAGRLGMPVYRRAVAGMFPVEFCAAAGFLDFGPRNTLLMMLSGFDLGGRDRIYPEAVRPLATPAGVRLLREAAKIPFLLQHWRFFVDAHIAAYFEWWRSRDFIRLILKHPLGSFAQPKDEDLAVEQEQRAAYLALGRNETLVNYSCRLLERFWERYSTQFAHIVVVEGQLNPAFGDRAETLNVRARDLARRAHEAGHIRFVPVNSQQPRIEPADWLDMAHVNSSGRAKYTAILAFAISPSGP